MGNNKDCIHSGAIQEDAVGILHSCLRKEKHNFSYSPKIYGYFGMQSDSTLKAEPNSARPKRIYCCQYNAGQSIKLNFSSESVEGSSLRQLRAFLLCSFTQCLVFLCSADRHGTHQGELSTSSLCLSTAYPADPHSSLTPLSVSLSCSHYPSPPRLPSQDSLRLYGLFHPLRIHCD